MKRTNTPVPPLLSIVIPMYNESEGAKEFHNTLLLPAIKKYVKGTFEIIYVNDGSRDGTLEVLTEIARNSIHTKVIDLSRNFGKEIAVTAGISLATGDATIIMDGDGQHPPELMGEFIKKWKKGAQVVVGVRGKNEKEGFVKHFGSKLFYKLFNTTSGIELIPGSTDYRLIDRVVRVEFLKFTERNRITRGLIDWLGFKRDYITFNSPARIAGEASYNTSQLIKLAANSFVSLSLKPLFFFGWVGAFITCLSLLAGIFIFVEYFLLNDILRLGFSGPFILGIFMSFMVGLVLISQAILATYLSHVHTQAQDRPLFVINPTSSFGVHDQ